jgi:hypothetical protein
MPESETLRIVITGLLFAFSKMYSDFKIEELL